MRRALLEPTGPAADLAKIDDVSGNKRLFSISSVTGFLLKKERTTWVSQAATVANASKKISLERTPPGASTLIYLLAVYGCATGA